MSIANILHAIKFKFAMQAKNGLDYLLFVSSGRSMYPAAGKLQQHVRALNLMEFGRYICCIRLTTLQARCSKTKTQLCSLLQFLTTDKRWYPPVPERKGLLLPASRGERPIIDGGRTPVAYSTGNCTNKCKIMQRCLS